MEKQFFVFGDSIAYGAADREGGWANRLRRYLDAKMLASNGKEFYMLYNLGVSGDTTEDVLARFLPEISARLDASEEVVVLFAVCINDSQQLGAKGNYRIPPETFAANVDQLLEQAGGVSNMIIFMGPTNVDESRTMPVAWASDKSYDNESIKSYAAALEKICSGRAAFISMQDVLGPAELADGLHPNTQGGEKMFDAILTALTAQGII